jgi:hypothetical protein
MRIDKGRCIILDPNRSALCLNVEGARRLTGYQGKIVHVSLTSDRSTRQHFAGRIEHDAWIFDQCKLVRSIEWS